MSASLNGTLHGVLSGKSGHIDVATIRAVLEKERSIGCPVLLSKSSYSISTPLSAALQADVNRVGKVYLLSLSRDGDQHIYCHRIF
jgi:hypothetical protein